MSWDTSDLDYEDTNLGMGQAVLDKLIMEKEIERKFENDEYKGE